jgi:arabinogalactan oligomer/maltooligosaccharide transport system permease protein
MKKIPIDKAFLSVLGTVAAALIVAVFLFPIYVIITASLSPRVSLFQPFEIIPRELTLEVYGNVLFAPYSTFFLNLRNSLIVSLLTLALSLAVVIPGAYALSRFKFVGRGNLLYGYFAFNQLAGGTGIAGLIALYFTLAYLNLTNSLIVLAVVYAAGAVPFNTWLLKTYFDTIPKDFDEAALVDGASYFDVMFRVLLPVASPGIATVAFFVFMGAWSEFIMASVFLDPENYTLPLQLNQLLTSPDVNWNLFAATSILYAIPLVVVYLIAQKYFQAGLAMGGVKR